MDIGHWAMGGAIEIPRTAGAQSDHPTTHPENAYPNRSIPAIAIGFLGAAKPMNVIRT